jgi:hypothetical protein
MTTTNDFSLLSDKELSIFGTFCEQAVDSGNLLTSISLQDAASDKRLDGIGSVELGQSIIALMEQGYLQRSGYHRYAVTPEGFDRYARSYIENFAGREAAVKDAVAATDQTTTDAIVASTGEHGYLINHVLRLLQRNREIGGFVTASNGYCVTRVSASFKRLRAAANP